MFFLDAYGKSIARNVVFFLSSWFYVWVSVVFRIFMNGQRWIGSRSLVFFFSWIKYGIGVFCPCQLAIDPFERFFLSERYHNTTTYLPWNKKEDAATST